MYKKLLFPVVALCVLLMPLQVHAEDWEVEVSDTIAGFGVEIDIFGDDSKNIVIVVTSPGGRVIEIEGRTSDRGRETMEMKNTETERAGVYVVEVEDIKGRLLADATFQVFPDALSLDESGIELEDYKVEEDEWLEGIVLLVDQYGNSLPGRPVAVNSSRSDDEIDIVDNETNEDGEVLFRFSSPEGGEAVLMAVDLLSGEVLRDRPVIEIERPRKSSLLSASLLSSRRDYEEDRRTTDNFRASLIDSYGSDDDDDEERAYGFAEYFDIALSEDLTVVKVNESIDVIITARDRNDKRAEGYVGKVKPETSAPDSRYPDITTFLPSDRGSKRIPLAFTFGTPGLHSIHVYAVDDPEIEGELQVRVVGSTHNAPEGQIVITNPARSIKTGKRSLTVAGTAPSYINLEIWDNDIIMDSGETNADGDFRFQINLDTTVETHILTVKEGDSQDRGLGRMSSPLTITLDTEAPDISAISLSPETVKPGEKVTVTVKGEQGQKVLATLEGSADVELTEKDGDYVGTLTAPQKEGTYKVLVTITDTANNATNQSKHFSVFRPGLPVVQNVRADANGVNVNISWSQVEDAKKYRIYYGLSEKNFVQSKETPSVTPPQKPFTNARITGLQPGSKYYFAVTALDDEGRESLKRSTVVQAATVGSLFRVESIPKVNGGMLSWLPAPGADTMTYRIRYGVQSGTYTEQRLIDGAQKSTEMIDLINGIPYYISFSALQRDGSILEDSVEHVFTPGINGQKGFHPVASAPLPENIGGSPPSHVVAPPLVSIQKDTSHSAAGPVSVPQVPHTGVPLSVWFVLASLVAGVLMFLRQRRRKMEQELLVSISRTYHQ